MSSDNLTSLVPVVYYDLIARVASGAPFVLIAATVMGIEIWDLEFAFVIIVFGGGYLLGTLLSTLSAIVNIALWNTWTIRAVNRFLQLNRRLSPRATRAFNEVYDRIDRVTGVSRYEGSVLEKMEAGAACADNLFSGVLVLLLLEAADVLSLMSVGWYVALLSLLLFTMILRRLLLVGRLDSVCERLGIEEDRSGSYGEKVPAQ